MLGTDTLPTQTLVPFSVPEKIKAQILVVDDEADIRTALVRILGLEGYSAKAAGSGKVALTMLKEAAYDLLVLDLGMPNMGGMEVLKQVQQLYPDLYTIILTGEADIESAIAAARTDAVVDFLLKPANHKEFVRAVARAVQKRTEQRRQMRVVQAAAQMLHTIHQPDDHTNGSQTPSTPGAAPEKMERFIQVHPLTLDRKKRLMTILDENPARMINARSESVDRRPAFRDAFRRRRCLVPADGFYEWKKTNGVRQPYHFALTDGGLFAFAGLWERWKDEEGERKDSFTILTTDSNRTVAEVHDRMPVILSPKRFGIWLDGEAPPHVLRALMVPFPADRIKARPVSRLVNSPHNDSPDCLRPPESQGSRQGSLF